MRCEKCGKNADAGNGLCLNCYSKILGDQRQSAKAQGADEWEQSDILFGGECGVKNENQTAVNR